jgi:polar amino acid transport system substrate-binding protein
VWKNRFALSGFTDKLPSMYRHLYTLRATLVALAALAASGAQAECSRVINVPMSATGLSVLINGDAVSGIYPDLLRVMSEKEKCTFAMTAVPRARLEVLFETGRADVLIPASKTPKRDALGTFVALIQNRALLMSIQSKRPPIKTVQELLDQTSLKVALVRGFDYGQPYQDLITALGQQGRLILEVDALSVARLLKAGTVDVTIMAPTILAGAVQGDERVRDMVDTLRMEPLEELPWGTSGVYLSNTSLSPADKTELLEAMGRAAKSGDVWKSFQRYYSPAVLKSSIRPLP